MSVFMPGYNQIVMFDPLRKPKEIIHGLGVEKQIDLYFRIFKSKLVWQKVESDLHTLREINESHSIRNVISDSVYNTLKERGFKMTYA